MNSSAALALIDRERATAAINLIIMSDIYDELIGSTRSHG
jgi:hypothetical protein